MCRRAVVASLQTRRYLLLEHGLDGKEDNEETEEIGELNVFTRYGGVAAVQGRSWCPSLSLHNRMSSNSANQMVSA
jgi:hypothetical protein